MEEKRIKLTKGKHAVVDSFLYDWLNMFKWKVSSNGYACRNFRYRGKQFVVYMHRQILGVPIGLETDHINHNRLDNRFSNLRICNASENRMNVHKKNSFGYRGIYRYGNHSRKKPWCAKISFSGKQVATKMFSTAKEAAEAYDVLARKYHKEFAILNFK